MILTDFTWWILLALDSDFVSFSAHFPKMIIHHFDLATVAFKYSCNPNRLPLQEFLRFGQTLPVTAVFMLRLAGHPHINAGSPSRDWQASKTPDFACMWSREPVVVVSDDTCFVALWRCLCLIWFGRNTLFFISGSGNALEGAVVRREPVVVEGGSCVSLQTLFYAVIQTSCFSYIFSILSFFSLFSYFISICKFPDAKSSPSILVIFFCLFPPPSDGHQFAAAWLKWKHIER